MRFFRLLYRVPLLLLHILIGTPLTLLCYLPGIRRIPVGDLPLNHAMQCWWARTNCRIFGVRLVVNGQLQRGPVLAVANHISWLDIVIMFGLAPYSFVAKAEISKWPVLGQLARVGNTVFHHRGSHDSASGVGQAMAQRLRDGGMVAVFAEGGIFPPVEVKRFHARLFAAAIDTGSPVQPVMLRYLRDDEVITDTTFLPGEHFLSNFVRLLGQPACIAQVDLLPAIDPEGLQRKQLAAQSEQAVREAYLA